MWALIVLCAARVCKAWFSGISTGCARSREVRPGAACGCWPGSEQAALRRGLGRLAKRPPHRPLLWALVHVSPRNRGCSRTKRFLTAQGRTRGRADPGQAPREPTPTRMGRGALQPSAEPQALLETRCCVGSVPRARERSDSSRNQRVRVGRALATASLENSRVLCNSFPASGDC